MWSLKLFLPDRVALILLDRDAERITEFVSGGLGSNLIVRVDYRRRFFDGLTGWAIREHQPVLSLKGAPDPREGSIAQRRRLETQCGSVVVVPVGFEKLSPRNDHSDQSSRGTRLCTT